MSCKVIFYSALGFLAGAAFVFVGFNDLRTYSDINRWQKTRANVVDVTVAEVDNPDYVMYRDSDGRRRLVDPSQPRRVYSITLDYEFSLHGKTYTGNGVWGRLYHQRGAAEAATPPAAVQLYYHPATPGLNVTEHPREYRKSAWVPTILGAGLMLLSSTVVALTYWITRNDTEPSSIHGDDDGENLRTPFDLEISDNSIAL